jgi:hypothetical protein
MSHYYRENQVRGKEAEVKYLQFMKELYQLQTFNRNELEERYAISRTICTSLYRNNYISHIRLKNSKNKSIWKWIGPQPDEALVRLIIQKHRTEMKEMKRKRKAELLQQLTIKPIRKAPVSMPEPIVKEAECDTSNSKMLLILAVGAMVGFMIATIIWK